MDITRRTAMKVLAGVAPALALGRRLRGETGIEIHKGPFEGTQESLQQYRVPDWFRDAKFGIWAHWGPQSSVAQGDWYARNMYMQGSHQYDYHLAHYGHPSKFGYKDLCPLWKAAEFEPEHLMGLYKRAGAKYFVSMGVHHDNFDLWNSRHTRWNAVKVGPHKDIVGLWRTAALKHGLRFGVSEHLWISYKWFAVSHGSDKTGPLAGVPYDGVDPAYADLYHDASVAKWADGPFGWNDLDISDAWKRHWFLRIQDLVDNYQPDLLYTDGPLPFENYGYSAVANLYNLSAELHGGQTQAVYNSKRPEDCAVGTCVLDIERGLANQIRPAPWQTDTCIGDWHYNREVYEQHRYKSAKTVVDMLVDVVSQNGNLLLNFPLPNSGQLDPDELKVLAGITDWMTVNSEGIYGTRPWKIYGEGPSTHSEKPGGEFNENKRQPLTPKDVRFTTKGDRLYAFVMGWPEKESVVQALGTASPQSPGKIVNVELLGHQGRLTWTQEATGLRVELPAEKPSDYAVTLKVTFAYGVGVSACGTFATEFPAPPSPVNAFVGGAGAGSHHLTGGQKTSLWEGESKRRERQPKDARNGRFAAGRTGKPASLGHNPASGRKSRLSESGFTVSWLGTEPRPPLQKAPHDPRPVWLAIPSLYKRVITTPRRFDRRTRRLL